MRLMEQDLAENNIKSARIINYVEDSNTKSNASSIKSKRTRSEKFTSFIGMVGEGFALKDVLDISRESNYFNLTRKKGQNHVTLNKNNEENDINNMNIHTRNDKEIKFIS